MIVRWIGSPGHACAGCGGCCMGVRVLVLPAEEAGVQTRVRSLGLETGTEAGRLPTIDGRCVCLDEAGRCRLHAHAGPDAKPAICRQYPLVVTDTGSERRAGIDPGCFEAARCHDAPPLVLQGAMVRPVPLDPVRERHEAALGALLEAPGTTVAGVIAAVVDDVGAFARRWVQVVRFAPLEPLLARSDTGAAVREALRPVLDAVHASDAPLPLALAPAEDAWARDVARRILLLRLVPHFPYLPGVVLLTLGGALLAASADPSPLPFARALAAWTRALRARPWREALVPGPAQMRALAGISQPEHTASVD